MILQGHWYGVMLYVLVRIDCAFAQKGWRGAGGCVWGGRHKELKTKQVSLFEKKMFIEVGFNLGAILGKNCSGI